MKKTIELNKQTVVKLKDHELSSIRGGGKTRSDNRNGDCGFSRRHGVAYDQNGNADGCMHKCAAW